MKGIGIFLLIIAGLNIIEIFVSQNITRFVAVVLDLYVGLYLIQEANEKKERMKEREMEKEKWEDEEQ